MREEKKIRSPALLSFQRLLSLTSGEDAKSPVLSDLKTWARKTRCLSKSLRKKISTMYLLISRASPGISKELFSLDLTTRETIVGRFLQTSKNRARNGNFCSRTIRRQFVFGSTVANSMQHLCNSSAEFFSRYVPDDEKHKIRHFQKSDTTIHENTLIEKSGSRKIFGSRRFFTRGPMSSFWILSALHIGIGNRCLAAQFHRSARTQSAVIFGHLLCFSAQHDARFHRSWGSL